MSLKDITITGSIGSIATQSYGQRTYISSTDEQSFPLEHITGSDARAWPDFVQGTNYTVDLVVNVTQSWSGLNVTPLGDVPYVHDTMEEFVNGEFSGSNYVVTDGNLNDVQCEQFLTVSTTLTSYTIFPYYVSSSKYNSYLNVFLNYNTIPRPGEAYFLTNQGFSSNQYLKIARIDQEGNNNTLSLQELTSFRWTDSVLGEIILTVKNITEYPDYYFYEVIGNSSSNTSLTDDNFLNYKFSATAASNTIPAGLFYIDNWTVISNASGYFNPTGYYSFANTPNCGIIYTASINVTNSNLGSSVNFDFGFWAYDGIYYTAIDTVNTTVNSGSTQTITLKGLSTSSLIGGPNIIYHLETKNLNLPINLNSATWILTQSQSPQSATSSVVIEPYLLSNFNNSDCNVLMNNYSENDISGFYRKVLYTNGGNIPSNFQQIISGTAEYAQVNDYLFNANASVLPRYKGVRYSSDGFNNASTYNVSTIQTTENINLGLNAPQNTPSVESLNSVVAYIDWWGGWPPERMNTSGAHVKYFLNSDGTITIPNISNISLFSNQNAFRSGERVIVSTQNDATPTTQYRNIVRGATSMAPIIYNQVREFTHPPMTFDSTIYFTDNNASSSAAIKNYTATLGTSNPFTPTTSFSTFSFDYVLSQGNDISTELYTIDEYTVTQNVIDELVSLVFDINLTIQGIGKINAYLYKNNLSTPITNQALFNQTQTNLYFSKTIPFNQLSVGDKYGVAIRKQNNSPVIDTYNTTFKISTNPLPTPSVPTTNLFITSSDPNSGSYIFMTSSAALQYYGNPIIQQVDISGSLFNPITLPFIFKRGDEFRFEGDETKVFMIEEVKTGTYWYDYYNPTISSSAIEIKVNNQISGSNSILDQFLVRRYVDDPSMILLEGFKPVNSTGPYLIRPEFVTPELNKNIGQFIQDLTQKGLI